MMDKRDEFLQEERRKPRYGFNWPLYIIFLILTAPVELYEWLREKYWYLTK